MLAVFFFSELENMNWRIGCVAGKYELENRLLLENKLCCWNICQKIGCIAGKYGLENGLCMLFFLG